MEHPSYYNQQSIEVKVYQQALLNDYSHITSGYGMNCAGNVIKYISRAPYKEDVLKDLGKARDYLVFWKDSLTKRVNENGHYKKPTIREQDYIDSVVEGTGFKSDWKATKNFSDLIHFTTELLAFEEETDFVHAIEVIEKWIKESNDK